MEDYKEILSNIGDKAGELTQPIIQQLLNAGLEVPVVTAKLIPLAIIAGFIYVIAKFVKRPAKWIFVSLLGIIGVSIFISIW